MAAKQIVVGVDGSENSARALRWATALAEPCGWQVEAVLAWRLLDQHHPDRVERYDPAYGWTAALAALDTYVQDCLGDAAGRVTTSAICDRPAEGLITAAEDADLLVVGARGLGGFRELLLGSVSQHCLHHAGCSVAIVHDVAPDPYPQRIVVGLDGSQHSDEALAWAAACAGVTGARIDAVHAWLPAAYGPDALVFAPVRVGDDRRAALLALDAAIARSGIDEREIEVRRVPAEGSAATVLIEASNDASMVVVGARGLGGFAGLLLGSVSTSVSRHARCPVVVVRERG